MSYGTFSCTLEGFDDSFETMKAIAEYLRDLAADDRYFGAEPPTPDAEMLARIAEREVGRRVEAHASGGGVSLRAGPRDGQDATSSGPGDAPGDGARAETRAPGNAPLMPPAPRVPQEAASRTSALSAQGPMPQVREAGPRRLETARPAAPASIAAKLQRIRAVVGRQAAHPQDSGLADYDGEETEADLLSAPPPASPAPSIEDAAEPTAARDEVPEEPATPGVTIYAPEPARAATRDSRIVRMSRAEFERALSEGRERGAQDDPAPSALPDDDEEDRVDNHDASDIFRTTKEEESSILTAEEEAALRLELEQLENPRGPHEEARSTRSDPAQRRSDKAGSAGTQGGDDAAGAETRTDVERPLQQGDAAEMAQDKQGEETDRAPGRLQRHTLNTDEDSVSRLMSDAEAHFKDVGSSRRRQSITQLRAALAATEAAHRMGEPRHAAGGSDDSAFRDDLNEAVSSRRGVEQDEDEPAQGRSQRRPLRSAPLRLVASQRIDRTAGQGDATRDAEPPARPRRISLAPARPKDTEAAGTPEPVDAPRGEAEDTAADAKVRQPEQRQQPTPRGPAQARAGGSEGASTEFAAFAKRMGASELPELLEAAAAYTHFVRGMEDFSRMQLMELVATAHDGEISREDGLRSFGRLLRHGTLTKVRGGRFTVIRGTRFNPARRAS
ncbi:hypothetical protein [Pseudoroseicyclus aestuarii]|uniref:hypothetical protein n=1 Tax=Pseudoroseicyclus aestuarii TaxID=1795041 RepID=UPI000DA1EA2A|nr:hypothetical protein [Pseudoroseicyclus aestuarii]